MSFRELRSFAETMRLLGYPNLISMESFRNPNVELVADCLFWLIKRYEPSAEITYEIERAADRVLFFKQVCEVALAKGRIKLNIKKLYQSDGNAVQEMLILAGVLKKAMSATEAEELDHAGLQQIAAQRDIQDARRVQQLCSDLSSDGSALFFLLEEESSQRPERQRVLSRATEVGEFERRLRDVLSNVGRQVEQLQSTISNLSADETTLEQKIENKKTQLERVQKRLKALQAVRPAFMEEYEKHESDLQSQFVVYLEHYRNLEYLEHELAKFNVAEDAILEEHETRLRVMRERLRKEELNAIRSEGAGAGNGGLRLRTNRRRPADDDDDDDNDHNGNHNGNNSRAFGNSAGGRGRGRGADPAADRAGPFGGAFARDAADGSSVSESDADDHSDASGDAPPRARGGLSLSGESSSPDATLDRYAGNGFSIGVSGPGGGGPGTGPGSPGGEWRERPGAAGFGGSGGAEGESEESESESDSDINTSDISTDTSSDEESEGSSTI